MFFFIILLFSSLNYSQSLTTHADDERAILLSLKRHWGNPSSLHHWNSTFSPCDDWPNISCNSNGSVTQIYLFGMNLQGSFPSKIICQLNSLSSIIIRTNYLWGTIPVGLSNCSKLEELDLSENHLTGKIAGELFSMKTLRSLNLRHNMLSGEIPTPRVVYNLLEYLDLSSNYLSGAIPDDIGNLYNLDYLDFSMNSLSGQIPATLLHLQQLSHLSLSFNNLTGKIPSQLFSMKRLRNLYLQENMLSGEIPTLMVAHSLEEIDLSSNQLNGSIPGELFSMKRLRSLYLQHNMLSGEIPIPRVVYNSLEYLDLSSNYLSGAIPGNFFSMKRLRSLYLQYNMLSGEIPTLMVAQSLEEIDLSSNQLSGSIPGELFSMKMLQNLYLQENRLSGEIPTLMVAHSLEEIDLSSNQLNGSIPGELFSMKRLRNLYLQENMLSGEIPTPMVAHILISVLNLGHNHLSGPIPQELGGFEYVKHIDLSDNQLNGSIPETLTHLPFLSVLDLSNNQLSGMIPCSAQFAQFSRESFANNPGLSYCPAPISKSSRSKQKKHYIIIGCGVIAGVLIWLVTQLLVIRFTRKGRMENDGEEWSMVSFQRLGFNKWDILGGLTDQNLVGNGGSGKVYRVITKKGKKVAVKSIRHEQKERQGLMEKQFLAEVKILGGIWHNNIVQLLCCIRGKTTKLLVYEYMDKQCVYKWLHGKKRGLTTQVLQWETRLKIAIGASEGLCYMHHSCNPPIIHRDIKSSNILVDSDFNAKIADFGLAKMMASEGDPETASAIVGTFGYIAPEYGSTRKVDAKSDIYSFGVVLLELATGKEAVTRNEDMNLAQWAHKHLREGNSAADAMDEEIKDPRYLEAMMAVFKLGLACTLSSPSSRPSMKDISQILQRCSENNHMSPES
nr:systemin receptor SR160-like [Ipomoea batatas]